MCDISQTPPPFLAAAFLQTFNQMQWDDMLTRAINNCNDHNNCFPALLILVGATASSLFDGCGPACYLETGSVKVSLELIHTKKSVVLSIKKNIKKIEHCT